jgi:LuxR family maltose regulon positive regulatory protein
VADAIRHTQAAGDWPDAARLLADHSFSMMLDGQAQTIQALLRAFPPGTDHSELAALPEFAAAGRLQAQLAGSHALASQVTGWLLATQARLGRTAEARAALEAARRARPP